MRGTGALTRRSNGISLPPPPRTPARPAPPAFSHAQVNGDEAAVALIPCARTVIWGSSRFAAPHPRGSPPPDDSGGGGMAAIRHANGDERRLGPCQAMARSSEAPVHLFTTKNDTAGGKGGNAAKRERPFKRGL